jgi:Bacterial Ig-like domain (group 3)/FG-GAP-like repeat
VILSRSRSLFCRYVSLYPRLLVRRVAQLECGIRDYLWRTAPRRRFSRVLGVMLFCCMSVVLLGTSECDSCRKALYVFLPTYIVDAILENYDDDARPAIHANVTGTDGSQTGIANFLGNLTTITQPAGGYFLILRAKDCSLSLLTGTSPLDGTATATALTPNYERVLHQLASLKTTADVYPHGCSESNIGIGSRIGVSVGKTTQGVNVSAIVSNGNTNGVYILNASADLSSFAFNLQPSTPYAAAVTTADLNGDGNGDLVVVTGYGTSSAYVSVMLGNADGTFQTPVSYPIAGNYSVAAVIDDMNGDGKLDIVAASDDQHISVLLGKGDGTFNAAQSFSASLNGSTSSISTPILGLITADLRNSGKKDIVCSNGLVLLGNGNGTFTQLATTAFPYVSGSGTGVAPGVAAGDLNNDGKVDLVVSDGSTISTWLGNADGTFKQGNSYVSINNSGYVTVSDLDGDGNADIYTGLANGGIFSGDDSSPAAAYALMGNGDGTFQGASNAAGSYKGTNLGDVNGDGQLDLITPASGTFNGLPAVFTVELGTSKGTFNPVSTVTLPSTIVVNGFNGPTTLTTVGAAASSFAVADLNGDGKADLAFVVQSLTTAPTSGFPTTFPSPVFFVALSNGDGTFATPVATTFPQIAPASGFDISLTADSLHIGDFNHDGHNDLIFTFNEIAGGSSPILTPYNTGYVVLPGIGNGTFGTPIITTASSTSTPPASAVPSNIFSTVDVNKDGNSDLLVMANIGTPATGFSSQLQIYLSKGDGTFQPPTTPSTAANPGLINTAAPCTLTDLNKDTKLDLICLGETTAGQAQLAISLGNGDGTFGTATVFNVGGGDSIRNSGIAAADFDGDGNVDLALLDAEDFSGIFYGKGDGTFTSVPFNGNSVPKDLINLATGGAAIAVDLNKDGKPDIFSGSTILINSYGVTSTAPTLFTTTTGLTASASSIIVGSSITFTAAITPGTGSTGTPTGTVTFLDGTTALGTGNIASGKVTYATNALIIGNHNITAVYSGDTAFSGSTSSAITVTVVAPAKITPTVTVSPSPATITTAQALTATITVSGGSGNPTPTGSVALTSGNYTAAATLLNGSATISIPAGSLAAGTDTLTVNYAPDASSSSTYNSASGTASVTVTAAPAASFTVGGTAVSISSPGATTGNTSTITVTPSGGFNGSVTLTASVTSSPTGANDPPTLSFGSTSPVSITSASAGTATLAVSTTAATAATLAYPAHKGAGWYSAGGAVLAGLLLFGIPRRRRNWRTLFSMLIFFAILVGGVTACGGKSNSGTTGNSGTTAGTYTVTVTATSGTITAQTTINITVI